MKTGVIIRDARKQARLTQSELAAKLGIAVNSVRLYEGGKRIPNAKTLEAIATATGCNINLFFDLGEWDGLLSSLSKYSGDCPPYLLIAMELTMDPDDVRSVIESGTDSLLSQRLKYAARILADDLSKVHRESDNRTIELGSDTVITASDGSFISVSSDTQEATLLTDFSILNTEGKIKALERISELTEIPKYRKDYKRE